MAGSNDSPRQKMIGMMYLVLTAMLALNVSNSVLDKFVLINRSLEASNHEKELLNEGIIARIAKAVADAGNRPEDKRVLEEARGLHVRTEKEIAFLEGYKERFVDETGGRDASGGYIGIKDQDIVSNLMVGDASGTEYGAALETSLDAYSDNLRKQLKGVLAIKASPEQKQVDAKRVEEAYHDIALSASEIEGLKDDRDQEGKNFLLLQFGYNTPMVGALASVSEMQTQILDQEGRALTEIANKVGAGDIKFDRILAMVRPESQTVASGGTYRADMFIAASSSSIRPTMTVNGKPIPVQDGLGKVEFKAAATEFDDQGISEQRFKAAITARTPSGADTTFRNDVTFYVARPVIQVQSASVQALYLKCGNELFVTVPSLGSGYSPNFRATGAQVIQGAKPGQVTLVPNAKQVTLTVSNAGNLIGTKKFGVRRIPRVETQVRVGNRAVGSRPIPVPRSLTLVANPDESFKVFLPKDARFRVSRATITLVRSGRAQGGGKRVRSPKVSISDIASSARAGDAIVVEFNQVQRRNFRNKVEEFSNFSPSSVSILIR